MGILNVTPDSFSDGGRYSDEDAAVARGMQMVDEGAGIIDVGGESTRPGSDPVDEVEEIRRVVPVIERLCDADRVAKGGTGSSGGVLVSVDTTKAEVARRSLEAGASIVNDVSALTHDPRMKDVVRDAGAGVVLMHMLGNPRVMQDDPLYEDVVEEVEGYLRSRVEDLMGQGLDREGIAVDPGIGFGKTVEHNLKLIAGVDRLRSLGRPIVVGVSRKSFLGKLTAREVSDRLVPSIAALSYCAARGVDVMRVHDVRDSMDAARTVAALVEQEEEKK
jgi:dihydropteroate synthase